MEALNGARISSALRSAHEGVTIPPLCYMMLMHHAIAASWCAPKCSAGRLQTLLGHNILAGPAQVMYAEPGSRIWKPCAWQQSGSSRRQTTRVVPSDSVESAAYAALVPQLGALLAHVPGCCMPTLPTHLVCA